jgi:hypothetical protein
MQPAKISDSQNCTKRLPGVDTKHMQKYVELYEGLYGSKNSKCQNSDAMLKECSTTVLC